MLSARERSAWARIGASAFALAFALTLACGDDGGGTETDAGTGGASDSADTGETGAPGPWSSLDERPCPPDSPLDAANFGVPFFLTHCTGCHSSTIATEDRQGAPANVNFDNVDEIVAQADRVWARSADQNETMPPINSVSAAERAMLGEWLACGAPLKAE
ncbi:MAG: hypothetical protein KC468_05300 [Myxococcales bacterium]|nr:hypothetical protein [Myxococcales bacterium]